MDQSKLPSRDELALRLYLSHMFGCHLYLWSLCGSPTGWQDQQDPASGCLTSGDEKPGFGVWMVQCQNIFVVRGSSFFFVSQKNDNWFPTMIFICKSKCQEQSLNLNFKNLIWNVCLPFHYWKRLLLLSTAPSKKVEAESRLLLTPFLLTARSIIWELRCFVSGIFACFCCMQDFSCSTVRGQRYLILFFIMCHTFHRRRKIWTAGRSVEHTHTLCLGSHAVVVYAKWGLALSW